MGGFLSKIWGPEGRTDDPDPTTHLTSREKHLMKSAWAGIKKDSLNVGIKVFMNLFKKGDYQSLFPFRNVPYEQLPGNKKFQAHCNTVMYSLSSIMDSLDDSEMLVELLKKQGIAHKTRGVGPEAYEHLKEVLIEVVQPDMNGETLEAWKKTLDVAFGVIIAEAKS